MAGALGSIFKLDIAAPPADGLANQACVEFLAELTGVPRSRINLVKGKASRSKVFEFEGVHVDELRRRLNLAK